MQKDGPYVGFKTVDFGVNSDISDGEDGPQMVNDYHCRTDKWGIIHIFLW